MRTRTKKAAWVGFVVAGAALGMPENAQACWDGHQATVGRATATMQPDATWTPEVARRAATWLTRIDALLPPDTSVTLYPWGFDCDGAACASSWVDRSLGYADAFDAIASHVGASPDTVRRARSLRAEPVGVQVFAGSERAARAVAERIEAALSPDGSFTVGFYDAGGYPAPHPLAHVVRARLPGGAVVYRVLVGAFLRVDQAQPALAAVEAGAGLRGFVRPLAEAGSPIDRAAEGGEG